MVTRTQIAVRIASWIIAMSGVVLVQPAAFKDNLALALVLIGLTLEWFRPLIMWKTEPQTRNYPPSR